MRIRCPSCLATYDVADALVDPPRLVRCARCTEDWMAAPFVEDAPHSPEHVEELPVQDAAPVPTVERPDSAHAVERPEPAHAAPVPEPEPAAMSAIERLAVAPEVSATRRRANPLLAGAWVASFLVLLGCGAAAYMKRDALMRLWPASARVYAAIGLVPADPKTAPAPAH